MTRRLVVSYLAIAVLILLILEVPLATLAQRFERNLAISQAEREANGLVAVAVEDMEKDHKALPPSIEEDAVPNYDRSPYHDPRALLVPVEAAGRALRVNVSLDEGLLARIDDVSKRTGLSRSALLARGARMLIATETAP